MNDIIGIEPLRCKYCNEIFENIETLKQHLQQKHNKTEFITSDDIVFMDLPWLEDQLIIGNALDTISSGLHKHSTAHKPHLDITTNIDDENNIGSKLDNDIKAESIILEEGITNGSHFTTSGAIISANLGNDLIDYDKPLPPSTILDADESCLEKCFSDDCCAIDDDCCCPTSDGQQDSSVCADCCDSKAECCSCECDDCTIL